MTYTNIELTFNLENGGTSKIIVGPFRSTGSNITQLKQRVIDFNQNMAENIPAWASYIQLDGSALSTSQMIQAAELVQISETEIPLTEAVQNGG